MSKLRVAHGDKKNDEVHENFHATSADVYQFSTAVVSENHKDSHDHRKKSAG